MKKLLLILLCFPFIGFGQSSSEAMQKLREIKELLDLKLITQSEYDSISVILKNKILKGTTTKSAKKNTLNDGFYYNGKIMYPEKFAESTTDYLGAALTYGLGGGGVKSFLNNKSSKTKVKIDNQKFTLQITKNVDIAGNAQSNIAYQQFFSAVQSPQDFALIKFKIKESTEQRWVKTGKMNLLDGYSLSISGKEYIEFDWETLPNNKGFNIETDLDEGEYAFIFVGTSAYSQNAIYTFSIEDSKNQKDLNTNKNSEKPQTISKPKMKDYKSSSDYQKALREYYKSIEKQ